MGFPPHYKSAMVLPRSSAKHLSPAMASSPHPPAILQIVPSLDTGGAERTTIDIAGALVRDGLIALVGSEGGRLEPALASAGGQLIRMPAASKLPGTIAANAVRIARIARRRNVKLIHARSRAPAWSAALAAKMAGVPFVTTYHGIYNASNALKRLYNSIMVRSDAVIANSEWTAAHIVREHGVARERITVIPRGVDLAEFDAAGIGPQRIETLRAAWGARQGEFVVLLPGRLTRWKGQAILIAALAQLERDAALAGIRAVFAGDAQGRDDYVAELRAAVATASLQDRVVLVGHVGDMAAAYLASDIVISASTDPEAFGRVAAEAGAVGRPVIATDHGGARETVLAGVSGLLVPPGDAAALARAISDMIALGPEARAAMGQRGREHVRQHFSLERMCADTIALYRRVMGE
jgi:glycosyltransferase involved in cell wall biosynthesis